MTTEACGVTPERAVGLLSSLSEAHGASGSEQGVRRVFTREVGQQTWTDGSGNIFAQKEGSRSAPRIMVTAHMDEVGFAVQAVTRGGLIKLAPLGGWWPHVLLAQRVRVLTGSGEEIPGVIGAKPPHFLQESEREKVMKLDDLFVDVGAGSAEEVTTEFGIRLGDSIVPDTSFRTMKQGSHLLGKAFDDRLGVAVTILTLNCLEGMEHPNLVLGVGTVQEEVGIRGAQTAVYGANPDAAIVLEGTPADDLPGLPEDERQAIVGRGPQIRIMDPSAIMNRRFVDLAAATAKQHALPFQLAVRKSGGTDAKAIHLHAKGVPTIVIGVPARYIHTAQNIAHLSDYLNTLKLVLALIQTLDETTVHFLGDHSE